MRLVIQRVSCASVAIEGRTVSGIGNGLLVLVGVETGDTEEDMRWLVGKTVGLRIFNDENGVMNRSVVDVGGGGSCGVAIHSDGIHQEREPPFLHSCRRPRFGSPVVREVLRGSLGGDRQAGRQRSIRRGYAGLPCQRWPGDDNHRLKDSGIDSQPLNEYYNVRYYPLLS